jgi:hypothetical protein
MVAAREEEMTKFESEAEVVLYYIRDDTGAVLIRRG